MRAYLVLGMPTLNFILKNNLNYEKKALFITDKIIIFNILKKKKFRVELLEKKIFTKKKNRIFKQNYISFSNKLKKLGEKNIITINKVPLNTIYFNFRGYAPRALIGIKIFFFTLDKITEKKKIKEIIYFNDLFNDVFEKQFYSVLIELYCKKRNLKITNLAISDKKSVIQNFLILFVNFNYLIKEIKYFSFILILKKILAKIFFFFDKKFIFVEPANDLNYSNYNYLETKFIKLKNSPIKTVKDFNFLKKFNKIEDVFFDYIKKKNILLDLNSKNIINNFQKKNKNLKSKFIYWCMGPSIWLRTFFYYLLQKSNVYGLQHGGKQLLIKSGEGINNDYEYSFCHKFYCYGLNKNNKNNKKNKIKVLGCLKTNHQELLISKLKEKPNNDTLFYVPIALSSFLNPTLEILAFEKYQDQKKLCDFLNRQVFFNVFAKIISNTYINKFSFNDNKSYLNPIVNDFIKYKNIKLCDSSLIVELLKKNPKVIIFDSLSTPLYESLNSKSEIILLQDSFTDIEKNAVKLISKRVFIVKNINQLKSIVNAIKNNKISKLNNNEFYKLFYRKKNNLFN